MRHRVPTDRRFFETVSSGDILVAAPAAGGGFTLENNGIVGGRTGAGTTAAQGPGGREFINDRQNLGTGSNHYENTLGGIATYPGVPQVASTAMDPLAAIRVAGLGWFSLANGAAQRGYNHTDDPLTNGTHEGGPRAPTAPYFQKGGGLGAVSILTREPPVEIGNRVWLDADFNGRQDPDEPAIQGAPVELFARGQAGAPVGAPLASTTTDAAGEYYFRSDQIPGFDPAATEGDTNPYVVVFGRGTGAVTLTGPNANHPGFAGITWADLDFTTQTSAALQRDSNPAPATGRAPVDVGSPGRNDHTIDAGFNTTGTFQIRKVTEGGPPAPGQTFTFDVTAATDFRGDDVLGTVNPATFQIRSGETAPAVPQQLPVGTTITIQERGGSPTYAPGTTQLITVNGGQPLLFSGDQPVATDATDTPPTPPPPTPPPPPPAATAEHPRDPHRRLSQSRRTRQAVPRQDPRQRTARRARGHRRRAAVRAVRIPRGRRLPRGSSGSVADAACQQRLEPHRQGHGQRTRRVHMASHPQRR